MTYNVLNLNLRGRAYDSEIIGYLSRSGSEVLQSPVVFATAPQAAYFSARVTPTDHTDQ